ncbi:MAG TPA: PIG-L family deacetylase [bacterium]|nr:PIG-L family deacetylase [bacterium]
MRRLAKKLLPGRLLRATRRLRTRAAWVRTLAGPYAPRPRERTAFAPASVLVIAPHIDDEIIGAGGTLLRLHDAGAEITVAYVFCGGNAVRCREAEAVRDRAGWRDLRFANLPDREQVAAGAALPGGLLAGDWDEVYLPHPHDNHPAHLALPRLLLPQLQALPQPLPLYLYEVWTPLMPGVIVDISPVLERKLALLGLFASQLAAKDYVAATEGLARYRALGLPRRGGAAEVFFESTVSGYAGLAGIGE